MTKLGRKWGGGLYQHIKHLNTVFCKQIGIGIWQIPTYFSSLYIPTYTVLPPRQTGTVMWCAHAIFSASVVWFVYVYRQSWVGHAFALPVTHAKMWLVVENYNQLIKLPGRRSKLSKQNQLSEQTTWWCHTSAAQVTTASTHTLTITVYNTGRGFFFFFFFR